MKLNTKITTLTIVLALVILGAVISLPRFSGSSAEARTDVVKVDVAEIGTRFAFDDQPVHDDGMPAYGNSFVTQGYIYPHGILDGSNGVLANGEPEFPDQVIGEWTCRGWFIGDGAHTVTGPWVITTQTMSMDEAVGTGTLITEGYEIADLNVAVQRAVTGGTGTYRHARGVASQELLGFNGSEGVNLRFVLEVKSTP